MRWARFEACVAASSSSDGFARFEPSALDAAASRFFSPAAEDDPAALLSGTLNSLFCDASARGTQESFSDLLLWKAIAADARTTGLVVLARARRTT